VLELLAKYPDTDIRWEIVFKAADNVYVGRLWVDDELVRPPMGSERHETVRYSAELDEDDVFEYIYDCFHKWGLYKIRSNIPETILEKYP
jgi:hypothetical protein